MFDASLQIVNHLTFDSIIDLNLKIVAKMLGEVFSVVKQILMFKLDPDVQSIADCESITVITCHALEDWLHASWKDVSFTIGILYQ